MELQNNFHHFDCHYQNIGKQDWKPKKISKNDVMRRNPLENLRA